MATFSAKTQNSDTGELFFETHSYRTSTINFKDTFPNNQTDIDAPKTYNENLTSQISIMIVKVGEVSTAGENARVYFACIQEDNEGTATAKCYVGSPINVSSKTGDASRDVKIFAVVQDSVDILGSDFESSYKAELDITVKAVPSLQTLTRNTDPTLKP